MRSIPSCAVGLLKLATATVRGDDGSIIEKQIANARCCGEIAAYIITNIDDGTRHRPVSLQYF